LNKMRLVVLCESLFKNQFDFLEDMDIKTYLVLSPFWELADLNEYDICICYNIKNLLDDKIINFPNDMIIISETYRTYRDLYNKFKNHNKIISFKSDNRITPKNYFYREDGETRDIGRDQLLTNIIREIKFNKLLK